MSKIHNSKSSCVRNRNISSSNSEFQTWASRKKKFINPLIKKETQHNEDGQDCGWVCYFLQGC